MYHRMASVRETRRKEHQPSSWMLIAAVFGAPPAAGAGESEADSVFISPGEEAEYGAVAGPCSCTNFLLSWTFMLLSVGAMR